MFNYSVRPNKTANFIAPILNLLFLVMWLCHTVLTRGPVKFRVNSNRTNLRNKLHEINMFSFGLLPFKRPRRFVLPRPVGNSLGFLISQSDITQ